VPFTGHGGSSPPSDTYRYPTVAIMAGGQLIRVEGGLDPDLLLGGLVGQPDAELAVEVLAVFWFRVTQDLDQPAQGGDESSMSSGDMVI
jgi:hypothetical protein